MTLHDITRVKIDFCFIFVICNDSSVIEHVLTCAHGTVNEIYYNKNKNNYKIVFVAIDILLRCKQECTFKTHCSEIKIAKIVSYVLIFKREEKNTTIKKRLASKYHKSHL